MRFSCSLHRELLGMVMFAAAVPSCWGALSFAPLTLTGNLSGDPFPSSPDSLGFSHSLTGVTDTFDFTFNGPHLTSYPPVDGLPPDTPILIHPDWQGVGSLSFSTDSGDGSASHTAFSRVTGLDDFGPPVPGAEFPGRSNVSGEQYFIYGTQRFNFGGSGTQPTTWTLVFDFTTLANGYLPAGTLLSFTDIDGVNTGGETLTVTAALENGSSNPFLRFLDRNDNVDDFMDLAVHDLLANSYTFDDLDPAGADNDSIGYETSENLDSLTIVAMQGSSGGAYGFKIAAPTPVPIPEPSPLLYAVLTLMAGGCFRRRMDRR